METPQNLFTLSPNTSNAAGVRIFFNAARICTTHVPFGERGVALVTGNRAGRPGNHLAVLVVGAGQGCVVGRREGDTLCTV